MRLPCAALVLVTACRTARPEEHELTHDECADMVRHIQRLESDDTGGMRDVLSVRLKSDIEGCLEKGTQRAYRCVLQAEVAKDLESCDSLMK